MTILGAAIFFAIFPQYFDLSPKLLMNLTNQALQTNWIKTFNPLMLALLGTLEAIAISPFIKGSFAFGEEFGGRAYLLPKLLPFGGRKAILIMGIIWGVWHWPVYCHGTQLRILLSRCTLDGNAGNGMVHSDSGNLLGMGDLAQ